MLPKVMFVDDEVNVLKAIARAFMDESFQPVLVNSPERALDRLKLDKDQQIKVVVSDQQMPEMGGDDLVSKIRSKYPYVVCMILTGYASIDSAITSINAGEVFRYLTKPFQMNDLKLAIKEAIVHQSTVADARPLADQLNLRAHVAHQLETEHPGITKVLKDENGNIII